MATTSPDPNARAHGDPQAGRIVTAVLAALVLAAGALGAARATRSGFAAIDHGPYVEIDQQEAGMRCLDASLGEQVPAGARVVIEQSGEEPVFWTQRVSAMAFDHGIAITDREHADFVVSSIRRASPGPCGAFAIEVAAIPR